MGRFGLFDFLILWINTYLCNWHSIKSIRLLQYSIMSSLIFDTREKERKARLFSVDANCMTITTGAAHNNDHIILIRP